MTAKRVLITGSTGFLGANLARRMVHEGYEVHLINRPAANRWRLADLLHQATEHPVDLRDVDGLRQLAASVKPDVVLHLATYGAYPYRNGQPYQQDLSQLMATNVLGTMNLLKACAAVGFERFVNTGSSSEYGLKAEPMSESDLLAPADMYGASKASATLMCQAFSKTHSLPVVTLRPFSVYGYYEESTRLFPTVIGACLKGEAPRLSAGYAVRDFVFSEDVVEIYLAVLAKSGLEPGLILNVGSGEQRTVRNVVEAIVEQTGGHVQPEFGSLPERSLDPQRWVANTDRLRDVLGWKAFTPFEHGVAKTVSWFREHGHEYAG